MSFWNLERALQSCSNPSRPSQAVIRAVQQLRCIASDDEIASSVLSEGAPSTVTALAVTLPQASLLSVILKCVENPSELDEGVMVAIVKHGLPRLNKDDLVLVAAEADAVDRMKNAPILGVVVRELRADSTAVLQSGLTCGEAAATIVHEISGGPWDADLAEAIIHSGGLLSTGSEEIIGKLVDSIFELESFALAIKVMENSALPTTSRWAFVQQLIQKYRSAERTTELCAFVNKARPVMLRHMKALRGSSSIRVIETLLGLGDSTIMHACADVVVRADKVLENIAIVRTVHWYPTFSSRHEQFGEWLQSGLVQQVASLDPSHRRSFLAAVAARPTGFHVLDILISSGQIDEADIFDALAQTLMKPNLPLGVVAKLCYHMAKCHGSISQDKWESFVVVLPASVLPYVALVTTGAGINRERCSIVVERMKQILAGPGGDNLRDLYTTVIAQLQARGGFEGNWRELLNESNALAQFAGLSNGESLARAQGGNPCDGLQNPLVSELNLEPDMDVAGQEWLSEFPPILLCRTAQDAEGGLVELIEAYGSHTLWFARRCLIAASLAASEGSSGNKLITTVTKKGPAGEFYDVCVRLDIGYSTAIVDLLKSSFKKECHDALWWSTFAKLLECSGAPEGVLNVITDVLRKVLPSFDEQRSFAYLEEIALQAMMGSESCRKAPVVPQVLHIAYRAALRRGKHGDSAWLEGRRQFAVHLIRTVSLDLCPDALILILENAMMLGASCQHLKCIAEAAACECYAAESGQGSMRYPPLLGTQLKRCRQAVSRKVILWLCDLAEQTEEELTECEDGRNESYQFDRVAKGTYQILLQCHFLDSCLSTRDHRMLLLVVKPLGRFIGEFAAAVAMTYQLVRLIKLEASAKSRLMSVSRCLHDKINGLLDAANCTESTTLGAPKIARNIVNLRASLRTLLNAHRRLRRSEELSGDCDLVVSIDSTPQAASCSRMLPTEDTFAKKTLDGDRFYASRFSYNKQKDLLGEGTYGKVYRAFDTLTKTKVALKLVTFDPTIEGCPLLVLRELGTIRKLLSNVDGRNDAHRHIVGLRDIIYESGGNSVGISFELCNCDLRQHLARHGPVSADSRRFEYARQIFAGLCYCHERGVLHRDVKPQNVLIKGNINDGSACLKLADFGLARTFRPDVRAYTREVQTLWYRAPEILLGAKEYGPAVDIWSAGAVIYELCTNYALFQSDCEVMALIKIFQLVGTPVVTHLHTFEYFSQQFPKWTRTEAQTIAILNEKLRSSMVSSVLASILRFWPTDRPSASRAVQLCSPLHFRSGDHYIDDRIVFLEDGTVTLYKKPDLRFDCTYDFFTDNWYLIFGEECSRLIKESDGVFDGQNIEVEINGKYNESCDVSQASNKISGGPHHMVATPASDSQA
ncbi:hypothetical protein FOL47_002245 [Perkinsus chesapeaki]|uniref:Cyclin-dependent kinase 2 homolog n=1 Tax=Perkinsus chesapeaki TaxID=330153 RepID=A0A7J6N153_PERCH|nr:hypothetical protein FOL47_002245 [Perkinsus chesapeaki]